MTLPPDLRVTTNVLWRGALFFALIDAVFVSVLAWRITPERFRQLKWTIVVTTGVVWGIIWLLMAGFAWEPV